MRPYCKTTQNFSRYPQVATVAALLICICPLGFIKSAAAQASGTQGKVLVRIRDRVNEQQLGQVEVQLIRFPGEVVGEQFTGSDGSVQFSGLSVGAFTIRVSRQGYEPAETQIDLRNSDRTLQSVDISLMPGKHKENTPKGIVAADLLKVPDNARKEFERGSRLLNDKKDFNRSIAAFQRAIQLYPAYADAYFLMGTAQLQASATPDAEVSLRKAIALDSRKTAPYYPLALLLYGQRRYVEERELLLKARELDPKDWRWLFEIARSYAQQGQWESALKHGVAASASANAPPRVHLLLADIYANSNRFPEAVTELELFTKLDPDSVYMQRVRDVLPMLRERADISASPSTAPR